MIKNNVPKLEKLTQIDLRNVWHHEAYDFTQWLAEESNLEALSDAIGLEISLLGTEESVGRFNVDILAEEKNTDKKIVIENQLESTNHDHLGKIITYASGHDAEIVIWIVKSVRSEHKQALDWLNEHTDDKTYFFLVKMEVWQIGNSSYAPKFNVVSEPNDWAKAIKSSRINKSLTDTKLLQLDYWNKFKDYALENFPKIRANRKPYAQNWYDISIGRSDCRIALTLNQFEGTIGCELYIPDKKELYYHLESQKDKIEKEFEKKLKWEPLENKKASRIKITQKANYLNQDEWEKQFDWLLLTANKFNDVFASKLKTFK